MNDQQKKTPDRAPKQSETVENRTIVTTSKRKFVEPEMSQPVDVLEATTFFQAVDSGATN
jgi:hypothetical protein